MARPDRGGRGPHWRPDRLQTLLLRACLLSGPKALKSWRDWRRSNDLDNLDKGSLRLLPLVYPALKNQPVPGSDLDCLQDHYRRTLVLNLGLAVRAGRVVSLLRRNGVRSALLKGMALVAGGHYSDPGLRPMSDVDLLTEPAQAAETLRILTGAGWAVKSPDSNQTEVPPVVDLVRTPRAVTMTGPGGQELDVHFHGGPFFPGQAAEILTSSHQVNLAGVRVNVPDPASLLAHVLMHALPYNALPAIRWAADAALVIRRSGQELDWDGVARRVIARGWARPVTRMLIYLNRSLDVPVPGEAVRRMLQAGSSPWNGLMGRMLTQRDGNAHPLARLALFQRTLTGLRTQPGAPRISLPMYLRWFYDTDSLGVIRRFVERQAFGKD